MGSAVPHDSKCTTCGLNNKRCYGHFGYYELKKPVINVLFTEYLRKIL